MPPPAGIAPADAGQRLAPHFPEELFSRITLFEVDVGRYAFCKDLRQRLFPCLVSPVAGPAKPDAQAAKPVS